MIKPERTSENEAFSFLNFFKIMIQVERSSKLQIYTATPKNRAASLLRCGLDVLVEAEEIRRVVFVLQGDQPRD